MSVELRKSPSCRLLSLVAVLALSACSGEGAAIPPAEVLGLAQPAPVILPEPAAPAGYPLLAPASDAEAVAALPEGRVSGPVTTGIGTDSPVLMEDASIDRQGGIPAEPALDPDGTEPAPERRYAFLPRLSDPTARPEWAGGLPASERACRTRLKRLGVTFRDIPQIGNGKSCGIAHPVEVTALSGNIRIVPAAKVNCQITEAFALWVKNELAPTARTRYFSGITSIHQLSSYSCRTMNSRPGAAMSEHARGNAIDIGRIELNSGKAIAVRQPGFFAFREKSLLNSVRADSCKYFTTVLGPGSDRYHKDHFHFDLRQRRTGYRHCD